MTDGNNIDRSLGRVEGKLDGVLTGMAVMNSTLAQDREQAASRDIVMNERIEGAEDGIQAIHGRITGMERGIEEIKPLADEMRAWKQRGIGAATVLTALGAIFGGAIVAFRDKILAALGIGG